MFTRLNQLAEEIENVRRRRISYFYENRRTPPLAIRHKQDTRAAEYWNFYNTTKFNGKKVVIPPGETFFSNENGVYTILVWQGRGTFHTLDNEAWNFERDELLVTHRATIRDLKISNTGDQDLIIFKFFGPDINPDVSVLPKYPN